MQQLVLSRAPGNDTFIFSAHTFNDDFFNATNAGFVFHLRTALYHCAQTFIALVGNFGDAALAGYGIGSRVEFLIIPLVFGFGAAMTSLVGMSIGAGNTARAERIAWIGGACASGIAGVLGILLALFPAAWITAFTNDPAVVASATDYIQIVGPFFFFQGLGMSLYFASQGASFMLWPVVATISRVLLAGLGAMFLASGLDLGLQGIYYAAAFAMMVYALIIAFAIRLGAWRR